jgi:hypothetical protein
VFTGTVSVKLSTPIKWEGKEIEVVDLDFGKVSGAIINQCERETWGGGNVSGMIRSLSSEYNGRMAAMISGIPFRAFEKLPGDDYDTIWQTVGAYVAKRDPQEFYNDWIKDDDEGFTEAAAAPEKPPAQGKGTKT